MVKKIAGIIVVLFLLVAIGVTFFVVKREQELRKKAAPATTLSFSPTQKTAKVNEIMTIQAVVDTGGNQITSVQLHAAFNPEYFEIQTITNSSDFPNILTATDTSIAGQATLHVSVPSTIPFSGETTVATLRIKPLKTTTTPVSINLSNSFAQSLGEGSTNAIVFTNPIMVTINESASDPTVTPTAVPELTPTDMLPSATPLIASPSPTTTISQSHIFTVLTPKSNVEIQTNPPTFSGTAKPNTSITLALSPGIVNGATTTASDGTWTFTPTEPLELTRYTATVIETNPTTGSTQTLNTTFTIVSNEEDTVSSPSPTPLSVTSVPATGSVFSTSLLIFLGLILLCAGLVIFVV